MATLQQKYEQLLDIQTKIETLKEQLNKQIDELESEKSKMIREFNAPIKEGIISAVKCFLKEELEETGEESLDISDIGIEINTGQYDDCNTGGSEGEITYEARELKFDDDSDDLIVGYQDYCGPYDWGTHDEAITKRLWVFKRIANYLASQYGVEYDEPASALVFSGDSSYYQNCLEELKS